MKDLEFSCDKYLDDSFTASKCKTGELFMSISESESSCGVILSKTKAAQLRDWLNEFLGEPK